jgi:hypothetical protein
MATGVIMMELLGRGAHADPRCGGSVLELASVLAGERWSTRPQSVHPALAAVADVVNDLLTDDRRRLLAPLAPWLIGTNTADERVWAAVANVCVRAASASNSGPDALASSPWGRRQGGPWTGRRDRRWVRRAIRSALLSVAGMPNQGDADDALCQVLVDCVNECRRLAGEPAVDPRLPLPDCPQRLGVQPRLIRSPGCDWMETGYQPVLALLPACLRHNVAHGH